MAEPKITPHKITKPIQLLAAWLTGLAVVNGGFLTAAVTISTPTWGPGLLVIASVLNVPIFLISLFILQTKFRPEMQEDTYYSKYLERKYSDSSSVKVGHDPDKQLRDTAAKIISQVSQTQTEIDSEKEEEIIEILKDSEIEYLVDRYDYRTLSELFLYPNLWGELAQSWKGQKEFEDELVKLVDAELAVVHDEEVKKAKLTRKGQAVAKKLESQNRLWNQLNHRHMSGEEPRKVHRGSE